MPCTRTSLGTGTKTTEARFAVLVIDMQKGILAETPDANKAVLPKINEVVTKARVAEVPVIWVQDSSYFQPGQDEYEVGEELDPRPEDIRVDNEVSRLVRRDCAWRGVRTARSSRTRGLWRAHGLLLTHHV